MAKNSTETLTQQYGNLVPTGRLIDGKARSILFDATKCIGCRHCVQACKDSKCTMCSDRVSEDKQPFCVQACPVGALDFGLTEEITDKATQRAAAVSGYLYGDREAGGGNVVYVLKEKRESYGVRDIGEQKFT